MSDILNHTDAGVMTLTFNRLDKKNSITSAMYAQLADGIEQAKHDALVRVVLIQGHETIFSAFFWGAVCSMCSMGLSLGPAAPGTRTGRGFRRRVGRGRVGSRWRNRPAPVLQVTSWDRGWRRGRPR